MNPTILSIYSGAGGIDLGFHHAGFITKYATDYWEPACKTLEQNNIAEVIECNDIREIDFRKTLKKLNIRKIDCLVGGPPCPAYSKSRFYRKEMGRALNDVNAYTLSEYFRALDEIDPDIFFFENVHGFIYKPHRDAFNYLKARSNELGYNISYRVVNAADYGVPQTRERFICIGSKMNLPSFIFPPTTHYNREKIKGSTRGKRQWITAGEAIGDLDFDLPEDKYKQAGSKHKDLLREVPPGDNYLYFTKERGHPNPLFKWRSRYWSFLLKLSPDRPSWTIQASHSNNQGPFHWKNRFLRIAELKRLQTFDDNYQFYGDFKTVWRQIGNAVPPLLAQTIATEIKRQYFLQSTKRITGWK